jgi:hypothetical protein
MEAAKRWLVEGEPCWQAGRGHTMAAAAEALGVAGVAEVACTRGAHPVLADEVTLVDDVALRPDALCGQVDVASLAVADRELILVMVTSEARGHRREERLGARLSGSDVTSNAFSIGGEDVPAVLEAEMLARELRALARMHRAVAPAAVAAVMRLFMALRALCSFRDMERTELARGSDPAVALEAAHALHEVRAMLEGLHAGRLRLEPEQARTGREREAADDDDEPEERACHRLRSHA